MNTPSPYPSQYQQPPIPPRYHSDSGSILGLGVVLLVVGEAITHSHTVPLIGLGLIIFAHWFD